MACKAPLSSSSSNNGKSTTQSGANSSGFRNSNASARAMRRALNCVLVLFVSPAITRIKSPAFASQAVAQVASASLSKNLSTDDLNVPSSLHFTQTNPLAPICGRFTQSIHASICFLDQVAAPGTAMLTTSSWLSNTPKPLFCAKSLSSVKVMPKRISGLSFP